MSENAKNIEPRGSTIVDFTNAPHVWVDLQTGKIITDPTEIAICEEQERPIREEALKLYNAYLCCKAGKNEIH